MARTLIDGPDGPLEVDVRGAGHATLPEQPDEIARTILTWLDLRGV